MTFRMIALSFILTTALCIRAEAASETATAKYWSTSLDEISTGEDVRRTCSAWTTAKNEAGAVWVLKLAISNGDALPPDAYPQMSLAAVAVDLDKGENQPVRFDFGDEKLDAMGLSDGKQVMVNNVKEASLALLKSLARGSTVTATVAGKPTPALSLAGFTASYRKLGSWCGFPTTDVAK